VAPQYAGGDPVWPVRIRPPNAALTSVGMPDVDPHSFTPLLRGSGKSSAVPQRNGNHGLKISATYLGHLLKCQFRFQGEMAFVLVPRYVAEAPAADIGCSRLAELRVESGNQALAKILSWQARNYLLRKTLRLSKSADLNQGLNLVKTRRHVAYHEM
jgi:hypothetical protein